MGILPGYGITFYLILQGVNQLNSLYGKEHSFFDHCRIQQYYAPGDFQTAKLISDMCGKQSVVKDSRSANVGEAKGQNINVSLSEYERNLINADQVMRLPPTDSIVFCHGMFPYKAKKIVYWQDERFASRLGNAKYDRKRLLKEVPPALRRSMENHWISIIDPNSKGISHSAEPPKKENHIQLDSITTEPPEEEYNEELIDNNLKRFCSKPLPPVDMGPLA
jgi:type IV secretion system protein VirD4